MKETNYYTVFYNKKYEISRSFTPSTGCNVFFYVKETVNERYSYGTLSDYEIIDTNGNHTMVEIVEGYNLDSFSTDGIARSYKLTLRIKTKDNKDISYQLRTDVHWDVPKTYYYGFQEWDSSDIFKSIFTFFEELKKYGHEALQDIMLLRRECYEKYQKIEIYKESDNIKRSMLKQLRNSLIDVIVPQDEYAICDNCFEGSQTIKRVYIHRNIERISNCAFKSCKNLTEIFCMAIDPPSLGFDVFYNISKSAKIFVPKIAVNKYKSDYHWEKYSDLITEYEY